MRLAILADIHGNLPALEAVLADFASRDVDQIIVAGDAINWGPSSREVLERLAGVGAATVRGNHEYFLSATTRRALPRPGTTRRRSSGSRASSIPPGGGASPPGPTR